MVFFNWNLDIIVISIFGIILIFFLKKLKNNKRMERWFSFKIWIKEKEKKEKTATDENTQTVPYCYNSWNWLISWVSTLKTRDHPPHSLPKRKKRLQREIEREREKETEERKRQRVGLRNLIVAALSLSLSFRHFFAL